MDGKKNVKNTELKIDFVDSAKSLDSQTVAEIQINWHQAIDQRQQFLENYHHCPLCSSELLFTHVTNFINGNVKEQAECLPCGIQVKTNDYGLH